MKSVVVTGASAGIGKATAAALVQEGYAVIGTSRNASAIPADQRIDRVDYRDLDLVDRGRRPRRRARPAISYSGARRFTLTCASLRRRRRY
ncbi:MAG: SDR family NAD(P)-dependent oxidoreductase [Solirubrobacteraceae bacterium]